jgi:hypothetical protein
MFEDDAQWSERTLQSIIWPAIKSRVGGEMLSVEADKGAVTRHLDMTAGIDALIQYERGIKSLASRIQRCDPKRPFNTFTVRAARDTGAETEFAKRVRAITEDDGMYPAYTLQGYVSKLDGSFLSASFVRTEHLYKYMLAADAFFETKRTSNAIFYVVRWGQLERWLKQNGLRNSMDVYELQMKFIERVN